MSERKKARIAIIGAGWWGVEVYLPALQARDDVDLVAVNRRNPEALRRITDTFGVPAGYADHRDMLAKEALDAVVVTSPHTMHYRHARDALEAGCHVLIDKPMATSAADARALVELAAKRGREIVDSLRLELQVFCHASIGADRGGADRRGAPRRLPMATFTFDLFQGRRSCGRRKPHVSAAEIHLGRSRERRRLRLGSAQPCAGAPVPPARHCHA